MWLKCFWWKTHIGPLITGARRWKYVCKSVKTCLHIFLKIYPPDFFQLCMFVGRCVPILSIICLCCIKEHPWKMWQHSLMVFLIFKTLGGFKSVWESKIDISIWFHLLLLLRTTFQLWLNFIVHSSTLNWSGRLFSRFLSLKNPLFQWQSH